MSDLDSFLNSTPLWNSFLKMVGSGRCQSLCFMVPEGLQDELALRVAESLWAGRGSGTEDLISVGSPGAPSGIDGCRKLAAELSLVPVSRPFRIGVVFSADKLSLPASNSLLKITEEPPGGAKVVFLLERDNLLPTLRSRVSLFNLFPREVIPPSLPPVTSKEWGALLRDFSTQSDGKGASGLVKLREMIQGWVTCFIEEGRLDEADRLCRVVEVLSNYSMSPSMGVDMVFLTLEEGFDLA